jgi:peptidyl-prolyl cis-trans isomerase D
MFETLRKMIFPVIIIVLFFFLAMIVLQWGLEYTGKTKMSVKNIAGTVNGEEVSLDAYNRVYNNLVQQETQRAEGEVSDYRLQELEKSAWQQLVYDRLLAQQAAKYNIVVTDQELYSYLRMSPPQYLQTMAAFQTDGRFDYQKYVSAMADPQASSFWAQIEPMVQSDMQKMKMQEMIIQAVEVSETELNDAFLSANEKIKVGYVNVPFKRFTSVSHTPAEEEMKAYYESHKEKYSMDERAVVSYLVIEKRATAADTAAAYNQAKALYDSLQAGADFAELAKTYSQDGSAPNGGDIGTFGPGEILPEFDRIAFTMKEGEVSQPFPTQFGYHIVKVYGFSMEKDTLAGKSAPEMVRKVHAAHILIKIEQSQSSIDASYQKLQGIITAAKEVGFEKAAEDEGLQVKHSQPFTKGGNLPELGYDAAVIDYVFVHQPKDISDVLENNSSMCVVRVDERIPAGQATYDEAKARVKADLYRQWVAERCLDTAKVIYAAIRGTGNWQGAAKAHGTDYVESDWITRTSSLGDVGRDAKVLGTAFGLKTAGQMTDAIGFDNGAVVLKLLDRQPADMNMFAAKRDSIYSAVRMTKQQEMYGKWVDELINGASVDNNLDRLKHGGDNM